MSKAAKPEKETKTKKRATTVAIIGTSETETAVTLTSKNIHHYAIEKVQNQLKELEGNFSDKEYKTDGRIDDAKTVNIRSITDVNHLVRLLSGVRLADRAANETADELGMKNFKFKRNDHSYETWKHDIQLRIHQLTTSAKKEELQKNLQALKDLISDEEKRQALYVKIGLVKEIDDMPSATIEE